jgi:outer membrane lipoprotein SlyB
MHGRRPEHIAFTTRALAKYASLDFVPWRGGRIDGPQRDARCYAAATKTRVTEDQMRSIKRLVLATVAMNVALGITLPASAACKDCGTVTSVEEVKKEGEASGIGAVAGGVLGGVLGHQIGSGRGNTAATVVGAAGGAYAGHQVEKNRKSTTEHVVHVKLEDGNDRTFVFSEPTSYKAGDKVKIVDKKLVKQ